MTNKIRSSALFQLFFHLLKWTLLVIPVSLITGSLVAAFLFLLHKATLYRWQHQWLLFLLPAAGVMIHFLYRFWGKHAERGNSLIIDEIHEPGAGLPPTMAPLVILTTLITHLFGGSAGREGTAVQVGGSMASLLARQLKLPVEDTRMLLLAGVAAGFGAVFGTPVTGAVFALEVLAIGSVSYRALLPCLMAGYFADVVTKSWGIQHTVYVIQPAASMAPQVHFLHFNIGLLGKVIIAGIAFGLVSYCFAALTRTIQQQTTKRIKVSWLIPVAGGLLIIALTYLVGTTDYLGLGVTAATPNGISIAHAFKEGGVTSFSWFWKLLFTAVTLGMGFKGGEVTPLFFIGATLGNTLAVMLGVPIDLLAGLGFIAVFAGAANTPLACTIMGVELFGGDYILYYAVACFTAYYFSGYSGIYGTQRVGVRKF